MVIATGGVGGLFSHTTNPGTSWGAGLAIAARAGAALRGMEFVQFHPAALDAAIAETVAVGSVTLPPASMTPLPSLDATPVRSTISRALGVLRDEAGLSLAVRQLLPIIQGSDPALVGLLTTVSDLARPECAGSHWRTDAASDHRSMPGTMPLQILSEALIEVDRLTAASLPRSA